MSSRFTFAPEVQVLLDSDTPQGKLARSWLRFAKALLGEDGIPIEEVVTPDVRCHELEAAGFAPGVAGLKLMRQQVNAALPDETAFVAAMRLAGPDVLEVELHATGTHRAEFFGRRASGERIWVLIRTLNRFAGERMAQRWDRADFGPALRQIDAALARQQP